jgi:hypothetical protein
MAFTKPREMEPENALPIILDGLENRKVPKHDLQE